MVTSSLAARRIATARRFGTVALTLAITLGVLTEAQAVYFSVGSREVIYSTSKRKSKSLSSWPDGNMGVILNSNGTYDFYGANGGKPVRTTGTLTDPGKAKKSVSIDGLPKKTFDYVSGGPVYQDPASGARLMIYHAEKHGKSAKDYYSVLGLAVATDTAGLKFRDLGTIIEPNLQSGQTEIGGGTFAVVDNHLNIYYRDWHIGGGTAETAVARAPLADLVNNALSGRGTAFTKYFEGDWSQPGIGGKASALELYNPWNNWAAVSTNDYLGQLVMVSAANSTSQTDLFITTSQDGINWSPRQTLVADAGEQFYPTMIGTGADPTHTSKSFYVYYTDSQKGAWNRWKDAELVRREITLDPLAPPPDPLQITNPTNPLPPEPMTPSDWLAVSDYSDDFQIGMPATGWKYVWNPTGTLGNSAEYKSLFWSNTAQAYNTTGGNTPVPGKSSHHDDYLNLSSYGGHPGQPKYLPIAGYTIQAEDGDGLYRLADTSIQKVDGVLSKSEDGLNVLVYVNNTFVGPAAGVLTDGQFTNFDRELGQLKVGDTVWVMVDPLKNQYYDSFMGFDFAIQKGVQFPPMVAQAAATYSLMSSAAVPEPGTATIFILAIAQCMPRRRR